MLGLDYARSPQHVAGGAVVAMIVMVAGRRWVRPSWVLVVFAVGVAMIAESALEILEYALDHGAQAHMTAYEDTIVDTGSTLVGAVVGALVMTFAWSRTARVARGPTDR